MKSPLSESTKEIVRLAIFAGVAGIVASVLESLSNLEPTATTVILTAILRFVDKFVHENKSVKLNGLMPF